MYIGISTYIYIYIYIYVCTMLLAHGDPGMLVTAAGKVHRSTVRAVSAGRCGSPAGVAVPGVGRGRRKDHVKLRILHAGSKAQHAGIPENSIL